jgi:hypothetical protein
MGIHGQITIVIATAAGKFKRNADFEKNCINS